MRGRKVYEEKIAKLELHECTTRCTCGVVAKR